MDCKKRFIPFSFVLVVVVVIFTTKTTVRERLFVFFRFNTHSVVIMKMYDIWCLGVSHSDKREQPHKHLFLYCRLCLSLEFFVNSHSLEDGLSITSILEKKVSGIGVRYRFFFRTIYDILLVHYFTYFWRYSLLVTFFGPQWVSDSPNNTKDKGHPPLFEELLLCLSFQFSDHTQI